MVSVYREAKRRVIYLALFTYPQGGGGGELFYYLPNQLDKMKLGSLFTVYNQVHFYDFVAN